MEVKFLNKIKKNVEEYCYFSKKINDFLKIKDCQDLLFFAKKNKYFFSKELNFINNCNNENFNFLKNKVCYFLNEEILDFIDKKRQSIF